MPVKVHWGNSLVAMVTPMTAQGKINLELAIKLCQHIVHHGCDGVVLCGTTGEAATLTVQQKLALFQAVGEAIDGEATIIAGVGTNNTQETVDLIKAANSLPVSAYMVITPYYNKPNISGLKGHYQAVCSATERPIMMYNVPSRTGLEVSLDDYGILLNHCPGVTAVKEATADFNKAIQLPALHPRIAFFSGNDNLTLPLMAMGYQGVVSVAGNVVPAQLAQLVKMISSGDLAGARKLNSHLTPLYEALFIETNPVPIKAALEIQGWPVGPPRLPLGALTTSHRRQLEKVLAQYPRGV